MSAYKMSNDDKRIVFMVAGVVITFVLFFTTIAAIQSKSWTPVIVALEIMGSVIGTIVLFYYVISSLWIVAKRLFPTDKDK